MKKTKILIPLDSSERSTHSISWTKKYFDKNDIEITLMNVREIIVAEDIIVPYDLEDMPKESDLVLDEASLELEGYEVEKYFTAGYAPDEILKKAEEGNFDMIVMTKSTKKGLTRMIGSVTVNVVRHAKCIVMIVPE